MSKELSGVEKFVQEGNQATLAWFAEHDRAAEEAMKIMLGSTKDSEKKLKKERDAAKKIYDEATSLGFTKESAERISGYHE